MEEQNRWEKRLERLKTGLWGAGIVISILGARSLGAFHVLELMALDRLLALSAQLSVETIDKNITIVEIGPPYVEGAEDKGYTINANRLADISDAIFANEPAAVGIDIFEYRIIKDSENKLLSTINQHPNLITVENNSSNPSAPLKGLSENQLLEQVGFNDLIVDRDGSVRRALLGAYDETDSYKKSFAVQIIQQYFKNKVSGNETISLENGIIDPKTMRFGSVSRFLESGAYYGYADGDIFDTQIPNKLPRSDIKPFEVISAR